MKNDMKKYSCHQGVALITVMLVVALAAILATQMTARLQLQLQKTANIEENQQAYWYAMGAEAFAKRVLIMSFDGQDNVTHLGQLWAQGENSYPVDYGNITGEIIDLQSCFNLNALRSEKSTSPSASPSASPTRSSTEPSTGSNNLAAEALERLILAINIDNVGSFEAKDMVDALTDWVDDNGLVTNNGGAEDSEYSSKDYPYLPANNYLGSLNELRVVEHFTLAIINKLKPYVCVIPNSNLYKINVNTINSDHVEILTAVLNVPKSVAENIISGRGEEGYKKIEDVFVLPELTALKLTKEQKEQLVVDSEYFKLKTKTTFNNSYFFLSSIMKNEKNNQINIISRTIGRD